MATPTAPEKKNCSVGELLTSSDVRNSICQDVSRKYERLCKIGQGTFGEVFKARNRQTSQYVALKKVLTENENEGFPITAIREIKILQLMKHENVVNLIEVCTGKASLYANTFTFFLVFEFCENDLEGLLKNRNVKFTLGEIKMVMKQLFNGLFFIHSSKILHRDMKSANILITKSGVLKIADFGLARAFSGITNGQPNRYTNKVVTLWYRPPELLLGERNYGPPIDVWGAGCIMAEMWTRSPIMQGTSEQHQLTLISQLCGSINSESFPGVENLDLFKKIVFRSDIKRKLKQRLQVCVKDADGLDLLDKLLILDPAKRLDCDTALDHQFFWSDPMPMELGTMLSKHKTSMYSFSSLRNHNLHGDAGGHHSRARPTEDKEQFKDRVF